MQKLMKPGGTSTAVASFGIVGIARLAGRSGVAHPPAMPAQSTKTASFTVNRPTTRTPITRTGAYGGRCCGRLRRRVQLYLELFGTFPKIVANIFTKRAHQLCGSRVRNAAGKWRLRLCRKHSRNSVLPDGIGDASFRCVNIEDWR